MSENGENGSKGARKVRPIYTLIPRADGAFDIHKCFGLEEVRKVLSTENIGSDDPRLESVVLIRGDEIPLAVEKQVKFTFGPR
jgi:hypothetical protein